MTSLESLYSELHPCELGVKKIALQQKEEKQTLETPNAGSALTPLLFKFLEFKKSRNFALAKQIYTARGFHVNNS